MQVHIAGVLDLSRDDESPLLQFFKQADSKTEPPGPEYPCRRDCWLYNTCRVARAS